MDFLTAWEAGNLKSRCWQGYAPSEGSGGPSLLPSSSFWWLQSSLACDCLTPGPASVSASVFHTGNMFTLLLLFSHSAVSDSATPWTAARQASLSSTISRSLLKLMSIDLVMPSNHLVLSSPSPPAFSLFQHQGLFQWVDSLHRLEEYWSFSFSISPPNEYSELISVKIDWFDLLAVQGTLESSWESLKGF